MNIKHNIHTIQMTAEKKKITPWRSIFFSVLAISLISSSSGIISMLTISTLGSFGLLVVSFFSIAFQCLGFCKYATYLYLSGKASLSVILGWAKISDAIATYIDIPQIMSLKKKETIATTTDRQNKSSHLFLYSILSSSPPTISQLISILISFGLFVTSSFGLFVTSSFGLLVISFVSMSIQCLGFCKYTNKMRKSGIKSLKV